MCINFILRHVHLVGWLLRKNFLSLHYNGAKARRVDGRNSPVKTRCQQMTSRIEVQSGNSARENITGSCQKDDQLVVPV